MSTLPIRTPDRNVEVAWFSALCNEDCEFLGEAEGGLRSSVGHCSALVKQADTLGSRAGGAKMKIFGQTPRH